MCLDYVYRRYWFIRKKPRIGYKIFIKTQDGSLVNAVMDGVYNLNQWYDSKHIGTARMCGGYDYKNYKHGFHVIETLTQAVLWNEHQYNNYPGYVICKVEYSHVVAKGLQNHCSVLIAQKMRILEEVVE